MFILCKYQIGRHSKILLRAGFFWDSSTPVTFHSTIMMTLTQILLKGAKSDSQKRFLFVCLVLSYKSWEECQRKTLITSKRSWWSYCRLVMPFLSTVLTAFTCELDRANVDQHWQSLTRRAVLFRIFFLHLLLCRKCRIRQGIHKSKLHAEHDTIIES